MSPAALVLQFSPNMHPPGQVVYHLPGRHGTEQLDGHPRYASRTACGRLVYRGPAQDVDHDKGPVPFRARAWTPATYTRLDHAELLGPLCQQCEARA